MSTVWLVVKCCSAYVLFMCSMFPHWELFESGFTWILLVLSQFFFHFPLSASSYSGTTNDAHLTEQSLFPQGVWRSLVWKEWHLETKMWVLAVFAAVRSRFSMLLGLSIHGPVWIPTASCEDFWRIRITSHFQPSHWGRMPMSLISQSNLWTSLGIWNDLYFYLLLPALKKSHF